MVLIDKKGLSFLVHYLYYIISKRERLPPFIKRVWVGKWTLDVKFERIDRLE